MILEEIGIGTGEWLVPEDLIRLWQTGITAAGTRLGQS
jgi:hypothetical protein